MYEEYLGPDYHNRIRKMLTCNEELLPNRIIDADLNIGGMKQLLSPYVENIQLHGKKIDAEQKYKQLTDSALYYLCGILCMAMKSRTSAPPYNLKKYQKRWDKKREGYIKKGNMLMQGLMSMG